MTIDVGIPSQWTANIGKINALGKILAFEKWYQWSVFHDINTPGCIPMVWRDLDTDVYKGYSCAELMEMHPGSTWLMFNEPAEHGQTNIQPIDPAMMIMQEAARIGVRIVGPNVMTTNRPGWKWAWLNEWARSDKGLIRSDAFQALSFHIYNCERDTINRWNKALDDILRWTDAQGFGDKKVWITETNAGPLMRNETPEQNAEKQMRLMDHIQATVATNSRLERVFWFSGHYGDAGDLCSTGGSLTPIGQHLRDINHGR